MGACETNFKKTREFAVSNFGVWNCDNPNFYMGNTIITQLILKHKEIQGSPNFAVVYKKFNSVFNNNQAYFRNIGDTEEVVFFVKDNGLFYGLVKDNEEISTVDLIRVELSGQSFNQIKQTLLGA